MQNFQFYVKFVLETIHMYVCLSILLVLNVKFVLDHLQYLDGKQVWKEDLKTQ